MTTDAQVKELVFTSLLKSLSAHILNSHIAHMMRVGDDRKRMSVPIDIAIMPVIHLQILSR
jgi:hypothetical protein